MITHSVNETSEQEAVGVKVRGERGCEGEGGSQNLKKSGGVGNMRVGGWGGGVRTLLPTMFLFKAYLNMQEKSPSKYS